MASPTIIIGIGTSGLYAIENAQRFYYETYKKNKPDNVEYLYIETNEDNRPTGTPIGNDIKRIYISLNNMADMIREIKDSCDDPSWLPNTKTVLSAGMGAGGIRSCGRLALWGRNQKGDNFNNVIKAITNAYSNVMHVSNNDNNQTEKPTVFVTGSLTGGTGAGAFIDMGYLIRHIIDDIKDLYGLFLLPSEPTVIRGHEVMYGNSFGAIKDLEFYNSSANNYKEKWPNGFLKEFESPPFELAQFISQDYQDGSPAISNLNGLYKMAGLYLFLNIAGIYEKRKERLVDAAGNSLIGNLGTFGLSAIQFPKDQIQEFVSSELSIELLEKLTNSSEYYKNEKGQPVPISRATIKRKMNFSFDEILKSAFETLNIVGDKNLLLEIEREAIKINKNQTKENPVEHIISMFASSGNDNLYAFVNNNLKTAENVFIDGIHQEVDKALQSTENIYYAKFILEDIVESIGRTLKHWKTLGISSHPQKWDNELRLLAINCTKNKYKLILEHDRVLKERLTTIFELMKMHLSIRMLVDISNHVKQGKVKLKGGQNELPKIEFFDKLIKRINNLIGKNDDNSEEGISLYRRLSNIKGDIKDTTIPILRVYPSNSFSRECENAKLNYSQKSGGSVRSMNEIIGNKNILSYFKSKSKNSFKEELYLDLVKNFRLKIDEFDCIQDFNIAEYIKRNTRDSIQTARKATSPFLKIKRVLAPNNYLPRFVIGDDKNELTELLKDFQEQNFNDFDRNSNGIVELPELKNIVVFYDEKGNFTLKKDLGYISLMKETYENVPSGLADPDITPEIWKKNRSAYSTSN